MTADESRPVTRHMLILLLTLAAAWLLWSGIYKPLIVGLGAFSCGAVFFVVHRMGYFDKKLYALRFSVDLLKYWLWLGKEVVKSSIDVARIVIDPKLPVSPTVFTLEATAQHPVDQVILGNSITLTPGTLTLDLHEGVLQVHSLTASGARDLMSGEMDRRVAELRKD